MGVEFLQKIGRTIKVARDKDRSSIAERDLFTRCIELADYHELLRLAPGVELSRDDEINIESYGDAIVATQGDRIVGTFDHPCQSLRDMVAEYGIVGGRVDEVFQGARVAEIEIVK